MKKPTLLLIHQGALGDFVLLLPFLITLRKNYYIGLFCKKENTKVASYFKAVDKAFAIESSIFSSIFLDTPDDSVKDIIQSFEKILIFSFSTEMKRSIQKIVKKESEIFLIPPRPKPNKRIHVADYVEDSLVKIGLLKEKIKEPKIAVNPSGTTVIHPGAGSKRKRWDIKRFLKLSYMLKSEKIPTTFLLGPAEGDLIAYFDKENIFVTDDIYQVIELLKSARGFIGNDSGISHLSGFIGIPTLAIFGPSDPIRWSPRGNKVTVIRGTETCNPCFEIKKENCQNPICLDIEPELVLKEYKNLIE